jgi:hypothetical protein
VREKHCLLAEKVWLIRKANMAESSLKHIRDPIDVTPIEGESLKQERAGRFFFFIFNPTAP